MYAAFVARALFTGVNHPLSFLMLLLLVYAVQRSFCDGKYNLHKSMFNWVTGGCSVFVSKKIRGIVNWLMNRSHLLYESDWTRFRLAFDFFT